MIKGVSIGAFLALTTAATGLALAGQEAKRSFFAVFDNAQIKSVWNAETGESEPVFTGTGKEPPPECEGKNGWYAPRGMRGLIRCRTKEAYSIDHSRLATYPENYRPLRPKPGTDDPGPMKQEE